MTALLLLGGFYAVIVFLGWCLLRDSSNRDDAQTMSAREER